jgi:hypothetical protein
MEGPGYCLLRIPNTDSVEIMKGRVLEKAKEGMDYCTCKSFCKEIKSIKVSGDFNPAGVI